MNAVSHRGETALDDASERIAKTAADGERFTRRGACPALSAPMQTGDGFLVRLNPVAGGLSPNALIGLGKAALRHGNGVMEVTARGSLQIRGLTLNSASLLTAEVDTLGIEVRTGVPVQTGALAGLDPDEIADPTPLADHIREALEKACLSSRLGPKVSVVVDGGGRSGLDEVAADVRLKAVRDGADTFWQLAIAGDARTAAQIGAAGQDKAADVAMAILSAVAALGIACRARDLNGNQLDSLATDLRNWHSTLDDTLIMLGIFSLADSRQALGVALPFGHVSAEILIAFSEKAEALGVADIRPAPKRTILALCPSRKAAKSLQEQAETLGFVTSSTDPRTGISACPGAPACASGHIAARDLAAEIAKDYSGFLDGSVDMHISGCAKGCAHPGVAALTLVGNESGAGLVVNGTARDAPLAYTARRRAKRALGNVVELVCRERRVGENSAATLARLGREKIAEVFEKK